MEGRQRSRPNRRRPAASGPQRSDAAVQARGGQVGERRCGARRRAWQLENVDRRRARFERAKNPRPWLFSDLRGRVSDVEVRALRSAGASDAEILETIADVVLDIFRNYVNLVAQTEIDFPIVRRRSDAA
jgi:hypothetical protein